MEKKFKREIKSLNRVFDFIARFVEMNKLSESDSFAINLAIEELFTNMVKYNIESSNDIALKIEREQDILIASITDFDVDPFDPTRVKEVDIRAHLSERKVGGLGIHLVRNVVDRLDYEYKNRERKVTIIKKLEIKRV